MNREQILSLNTVLNILLVKEMTWQLKLNIVMYSKPFTGPRMISVMMLIKMGRERWGEANCLSLSKAAHDCTDKPSRQE